MSNKDKRIRQQTFEKRIKQARQKSKWKTTESPKQAKTSKNFEWTVHKSKITCSTYSILACLHFGMLEWHKIFLGDWTCKTPQGTRVQSLVHNGGGRGPHFLIFGRQLYHIHTPHGKCNRSYLRLSLVFPLLLKVPSLLLMRCPTEEFPSSNVLFLGDKE